MGEGHDLHMGMPDCAPGQGAIVFEEDHIRVFSGMQHCLPVMKAKAQQSLHMFGAVIRDIALADVAFNQHELFCAGKDIIFIAQEDDGAIGRYDVGQFLGMAKRTVVIRMTDGLRFLPSDFHIKVDEIIW